MYFEDRDEIDQENGYQSIYYDLIKLIIYESIRSNDKIYNKYISIIDEFISNKRNCEICGSSYHVIDFPYWLYNNMSGNINLCYECPVTKPYKKDLKANIKKIIELCEFIPNSDFYHFSNDTFSSRIDSNKWTQIFQIILQLGCSINADKTDYIKKHFKSWFHALVESGILPKGQMITSRGIKCVAKSGNICLSLDEQYIDNYLHDKGYTFIKEPFYPFHEIYNQKKQLRADWIVKDTYIEYFGLKGESRYDEKIEKKIRLCHDLGIKLIEIYPRDLRRLNEIIVFDI
jgi:hypothetical protein